VVIVNEQEKKQEKTKKENKVKKIIVSIVG